MQNITFVDFSTFLPAPNAGGSKSVENQALGRSSSLGVIEKSLTKPPSLVAETNHGKETKKFN